MNKREGMLRAIGTLCWVLGLMTRNMDGVPEHIACFATGFGLSLMVVFFIKTHWKKAAE